jgi:TolB-like protein
LFIITSCVTTTPDDKEKAYSLDEAIEFSSQTISENLDSNITVAVVNFRASSEVFSEYVIEETIIALGNKKKQKIIDRNHLESIRKEWEFQYSGEVNDESLQSIGKILGAQEIIAGQITDLDSVLRFRIFSLNVETAERKAGVSVDVAKTDRVLALLKSDAPVIAASPSPAKTQSNERNNDFTEVTINQSPGLVSGKIMESFRGIDNKFKLIAMPDHLNGIYYNGEYLNISIQSERDCYIKIFILDNNNNLKLIYPASGTDNDFIPANSTVRIPNRNQLKINADSGEKYIFIGAYRQSHISSFYDNNNKYQVGRANVPMLETTCTERQTINGGAAATAYFPIITLNIK